MAPTENPYPQDQFLNSFSFITSLLLSVPSKNCRKDKSSSEEYEDTVLNPRGPIKKSKTGIKINGYQLVTNQPDNLKHGRKRTYSKASTDSIINDP